MLPLFNKFLKLHDGHDTSSFICEAFIVLKGNQIFIWWLWL